MVKTAGSHSQEYKASSVNTGRLNVTGAIPTVGTGISTGTGTIVRWMNKGSFNDQREVQVFIDLTGLTSTASAGIIIGVDGGTANCNFGQFTRSVFGDIYAAKIECAETPATGDDDILFYTATESSGAEASAIGDLTETLVYDRAAAWAAGEVKFFTALPAADSYLYLVGNGDTAGTYTAGQFLVTFYGNA